MNALFLSFVVYFYKSADTKPEFYIRNKRELTEEDDIKLLEKHLAGFIQFIWKKLRFFSIQ